MDTRYITGLVFLSITVVVAVVFAEPKFREIQLINQSLEEKQKEFDAQQFLIREMDGLNKKFLPIIEKIDKLKDVLPSSVNIADLLVQMEYIASRNAVIIKNISFSGPNKATVKNGQYSVVGVNMSISGTYEALLSFNDDIKNNIHLMDIKSLSISRAGSAGDNSEPNSDENLTSTSTEETVVISNTPKKPIFNYNVAIDVYYQ